MHIMFNINVNNLYKFGFILSCLSVIYFVILPITIYIINDYLKHKATVYFQKRKPFLITITLWSICINIFIIHPITLILNLINFKQNIYYDYWNRVCLIFLQTVNFFFF